MSQYTADPEDAAVAAAVRALCEDRPLEQGHPSSDTLLAYSERALSPEAAESLREHVELCSECARRCLEFSAFSLEAQIGDPEELSRQTIAASWEDLRESLVREDLLGEPAVVVREETDDEPVVRAASRFRQSAIGQLFGSLRFAYAMAAVFLLATLGLSTWLAFEIRMRSSPAGARMYDLQPFDRNVRETATPARRIPETSGTLVLSLSSLKAVASPDGGFRAKIFASVGAERSKWNVSLKREPEGFFILEIPGRSLDRGEYEIKIYDSREEFVDRYLFEIESARDDPAQPMEPDLDP